jgi:hypothetical protein
MNQRPRNTSPVPPVPCLRARPGARQLLTTLLLAAHPDRVSPHPSLGDPRTLTDLSRRVAVAFDAAREAMLRAAGRLAAAQRAALGGHVDAETIDRFARDSRPPLAVFVNEWSKYDAAIAAVRERLGVSVPSAASPTTAASTMAPTGEPDPADLSASSASEDDDGDGPGSSGSHRRRRRSSASSPDADGGHGGNGGDSGTGAGSGMGGTGGGGVGGEGHGGTAGSSSSTSSRRTRGERAALMARWALAHTVLVDGVAPATEVVKRSLRGEQPRAIMHDLLPPGRDGGGGGGGGDVVSAAADQIEAQVRRIFWAQFAEHLGENPTPERLGAIAGGQLVELHAAMLELAPPKSPAAEALRNSF